jgi:hypothetical protein
MDFDFKKDVYTQIPKTDDGKRLRTILEWNSAADAIIIPIVKTNGD